MNDPRRWLALGAVALATFMTYLDNNVVNVALPSIQRDLGLTISGLEWIVSGYILVFAGLLLVGGRLADVFGVRRALLAGLAVFTVSSLVAGLASGQEMLIAARAVQGVGAALLTPAALAVLPAMFPDPRERGLAIGIWGGVGALALAIGPFTGGLLSEHAHWGWIFLINVPIGAVTAALALAGVRGVPGGRGASWRRLDPAGLATSATALFALTFALIEGESRGWTSGVILGCFAVSALAAALFVVAERRTADPMIDLSLVRHRVFSGGLLAMGLWSFGIFGIYFFTALYLQGSLGFSPTEAGAAFVPMALVMAVVAPLSGRAAARFGAAATVAAGLALMAVAVGAISGVGAGDGYPDLLPWFLLYGLGAGLLLPLTDVVLGVLPADRAGVASGTLNVSREVFGLLGITVLGAILNSRQSGHLRDGLAPQDAFLEAYQSTLLVAAAIVAVGIPLSLYALRGARPAVTIVAGPAEAVPEPAAR
ncbi:drug resistance transporter, EmrB/QacA subfamily [Thermomonospora echinospora]|uniref:Drug resistance transporter, EmrB/QacA subfamily n=1 Tax=Thermomonospora echinospora TaxID=1992 RepID=A0A1H5SJ87_9ACTN|nr:MFS transporter [Thermomonospora echinospora]SEF49871.1 drug resistance transporter, EmrB/QacA subfamily [Thermomonospora echinospora]